jgi:hypothetical protein
MTTATVYTLAQITKRSTTQLIAMYNRVFNTNAWDEWFNPYERRQEMIMCLWAEMQAAQFVEGAEQAAEPYRALEIRISQDGLALIWTANKPNENNRKFDDATISLVRSLREEGESVEFISATFGMPKNRVYRICRGDVYAQ